MSKIAKIHPQRATRDLPPRIAASLLFWLFLTSGCASNVYERWADRVVGDLLHEGTDEVLGGREDEVQYPESTSQTIDQGSADASDSGAHPAPPSDASEEPPRLLDLRDCLLLATGNSRQYLNEEESLYLTALSLTGARHTFSPQLAAGLSALRSDSTGSEESRSVDANAGLSQILPFGGSLNVSGTTQSLLDAVLFDNEADLFGDRVSQTSSSISVTLRQPLLRGAGYENSHESLTQAERNLIYAIRNFELFREDFSIDVATRFYDLVQQKQSIGNTRNNQESFVFLRKQADALFQVGRRPQLDVLRARRNELQAKNQLIADQEAYKQSLDQFKIFLGVSILENIDVIDASPQFIPTDYDLDSAVQGALHNRLDYLNRREQLEDNARAVRIARNDLLPDLDFDFTYNLASDPTQRPFRQGFDDSTYTLGLTLSLPVNRVQERNRYRSSQISYDRAERDLEEFRDTLILGIRSLLRELSRRRQSLDIQQELIQSEKKNVKIADIRFRQGEIPNRDVVEAQQSLLSAQNGYIRELVSYEIARLRLLRNLGILFIDDNGISKA